MERLNFTKINSRLFQDLNSWAQKRIVGLFAFNILVMLMIVLRSAGYFDPFFPITINFIVLLALILSIILLGVGNRIMFLTAFVFWILAAALKILNVDVWAERTAVYTFQALVVGVVLLIWESLFDKRKEHDV